MNLIFSYFAIFLNGCVFYFSFAAFNSCLCTFYTVGFRCVHYCNERKAVQVLGAVPQHLGRAPRFDTHNFNFPFIVSNKHLFTAYWKEHNHCCCCCCHLQTPHCSPQCRSIWGVRF